MKKILITNYKNSILTCLEEEDCFYEIELTNTDNSILGNIYVGRVEKKLKNIHAYFISYGSKKTAFLSEEDCKNPIILSTPSKQNKTLVEGTLVLVQITKEAIKTKDPTVSTNITLQGKYTILEHNHHLVRFSSKLNKRKKNSIKSNLNMDINKKYGITIRTQANYLEESAYEKIDDELHSLYLLIETILSNAKALSCHTLIHQSEPKYLTKIRDLNLKEFEKITTDDPIIFEKLTQYFLKTNPLLLPLLSYYNDENYSLHKLHRIEKRLQDALNKIVYLKNGSTLLIEQTEAMNVIDVNSGKALKGKMREESFYKINIIAATEIAKQIRLRNLSGIIIIDFINMKESKNIQKLITHLSSLLKNDPIKTQYIDITKLGLVELTRKRISSTLKEQFIQNTTL